MAERIAAFLACTPLRILRGRLFLIACLFLSLGAGSVSANQPPIIILVVNSTSGMAPFDVVFDASQSTDADGSITHFDWQFGDGTEAEGPIAPHRFVVAGEYTVMLSALDDEGAVSQALVTINVDPRTIPFASFTYSVTGPPLEIRFDASYSKSERPVVSYQWDFGDGTDPVTCSPEAETGPPGGGSGTRPPGSQPGGGGGSGTRPPGSQPAAPGGAGTRPPGTQPGSAADDSAANNGASSVRLPRRLADMPASSSSEIFEASRGISRLGVMTPRRLPKLDPTASGQRSLVPILSTGGLGSTNVGAVSDNGTSEPGDGTDNSGSSSCPSPLLFDHIFPEPGTYGVTLTLTDDAGAEHHTTRPIKVMRGGYIEFEELEGMTGGAPTGSSVFRTSLEQWATVYGSMQLGTLVVIDNSPWEMEGALASGQFSGAKLDALIIASKACEDPVCAAFLPQDLSAETWSHIFLPGEINDGDWLGLGTFLNVAMMGNSTQAPLFGSQDDGIDPAVATLSAIDGNASRVDPQGFLSLGFGGAVLTHFNEPLEPTNRWLYLSAILEKWADGTVLLYEDLVSPDELFDIAFRQMVEEAESRLDDAALEPSLPADATARVAAMETTALTVQNDEADTFQLLLPPGALAPETIMSMNFVEHSIPGLATNRLYGALEITPGETRLAQKARLLVSRPSGQPFSPRSRVYYQKADGRLVPLPGQRFTDGVLQADVHHFSTFVVADVDNQTFSTLVDPATSPGEGSSQDDAEFLEEMGSNQEYASQAEAAGEGESADTTREDMKTRVEDRINDIMGSPPSGDPCEQMETNLALRNLGRSVGVDETTLTSFQNYIQSNSDNCIKEGTISFYSELIWPGCRNLRLDMEDTVPFERDIEGQLTGSGLTDFSMHWGCGISAGVMRLDYDGRGLVELRGSQTGMTLDFDPPFYTPVSGDFSFIAGEQPGASLSALIGRDMVSAAIDLGGLLYLSMQTPVQPGPYSDRLIFPPEDGAQNIHAKVFDGFTLIDTWTLHLGCESEDGPNGKPKAEVDVGSGANMNSKNEIGLGQYPITLELKNMLDEDCEHGRRVRDRVNPTATDWSVTGVDAKTEDNSASLTWNADTAGEAKFEIMIDDKGDPVDDESIAGSPLTVNVIMPTERTESDGWDGPIHKWKGILEPDGPDGVNFGGVTVREKLGQGTNQCYDEAKAKLESSEQIPDEVEHIDTVIARLMESEQDWDVGMQNTWCCDKNGIDEFSINYYRNVANVTPCTITIPQIMEVKTSKGWVQYADTTLIYTIGNTELSSTRYQVTKTNP